MKRLFKIEGIHGPAARAYSLIAGRSRLLSQIHAEVAGEAWIYDLRSDVTREANARAREKYGLSAYLLLPLVRAHSSMSMGEALKIVSSPAPLFTDTRIEERGILFTLRLIK